MSQPTGLRPGVKVVLVGVVAAIVGLPATGFGQVAPPPPPVVEKPPKLRPPPPRPPRPERPAAKPPAPSRTRGQEIQVPDIPFEPLAKLDENGKVIRIDGQVDLAALKHNPTVGPKTIERIRPLLEEWRQSIDRMVVDNLDIIQDVDNGLFAKMDLNDEDQKVLLNEVFKMLIGLGRPNNLLASNKALTPTQINFQRKLVNEYTQAVSKELAEEIKVRIPGDDPEAKKQQMIEVSRYTLTDMSRDAIRAYRDLLIAGAGMIDRAAGDAALTPEERDAAGGAMAAAKAAGTDEQKVGAMKEVLTALGPMRARDLMKAVLDARGPARLPELDDAAIKPNGAEPREDIDGEAGG